jgi:hypothetical protein
VYKTERTPDSAFKEAVFLQIDECLCRSAKVTNSRAYKTVYKNNRLAGVENRPARKVINMDKPVCNNPAITKGF